MAEREESLFACPACGDVPERPDPRYRGCVHPARRRPAPEPDRSPYVVVYELTCAKCGKVWTLEKRVG